jgi:exodeoxyribonuclease VII large subunit
MSQTTNAAEYSVSDLSNALKRTVEQNFSFVRVRGEVSGYRGPHSSGHAYFSLKDDKARIDAVIWKTTFQRLKFKPQEGLEVIATGKLTTFPNSSKYQIVIDALEPAGIGALMALLEERRKKLAAEGLFDETRKKPLPFLPRVIGVVTSPTGAVIHDILHRLTDRFPVRVVLWPVRVQGETAAMEVASAIRGFNQPSALFPRPDLLIVARGGGSLEDLWGFNEEIVIRAAADSAVPLISAVGHETDWTLLDHVADRRAPTPTGAAEMAVPVRSELLAGLENCSRRHATATARLFELRRRELTAAARSLPGPADLLAIPRRSVDEAGSRLWRSLSMNALAHRGQYERVGTRISADHLLRLTEGQRQRLADLGAREGLGLRINAERKAQALAAAAGRLRGELVGQQIALRRGRVTEAGPRMSDCVGRLIERDKVRLAAAARQLELVSYRNVLERGFALVQDAEGTPVRSAASVARGSLLSIEFHDGHMAVTAGEPKPGRPARGRKRFNSPLQGELL